MTKEKIELGDVVHLKSGSPAMTVSEIKEGGRTHCCWFDGAASHSAYFNSACLEKAVK